MYSSVISLFGDIPFYLSVIFFTIPAQDSFDQLLYVHLLLHKCAPFCLQS